MQGNEDWDDLQTLESQACGTLADMFDKDVSSNHTPDADANARKDIHVIDDSRKPLKRQNFMHLDSSSYTKDDDFMILEKISIRCPPSSSKRVVQMGELKHFSHEHELILNEVKPVVGNYVECAMCGQPIRKLIDAFYRCNTCCFDGSPLSDCAGFFMHKTCFELPSMFTHPMIPQHPLSLLSRNIKQTFYTCDLCEGEFYGFMYVSADNRIVCLKCVTFELKSLEERNRYHPGHNHSLTLVQRPALFLCDACNTTATDLAYICTECCFYIHESCANAPITYQSKFHNEHTLLLKYSLPQEYREFAWFCSICDYSINCIYWVYYCANCRFFAHVKCALSTDVLSESDDDDDDEADSGESNLMHLPVHDEASLHKVMQQCIMKATDALLHHSATTVEPSSYIKHWAHKHQLALGNNNSKTSTPYLNWNLEDSELLICNGCTKPIYLVDEIFYECTSCNFYIHRSCAQFPEKMEHHLAGKLDGQVLVKEVHEVAFSVCRGCEAFGNGIFLFNETAWLDIWCASLPRKIKHEGHRHPLNQLNYPVDDYCSACDSDFESKKGAIAYGCEKCWFYIHTRCVLRPRLVKHRWDPHPLYLIMFVKNVPEHPQAFDCEFCSEVIDPTTWFYHCNACDLSFHINCIDPYYRYSNVKFGATNIYSDVHPHPHGLTLVLDQKKRRCKGCGENSFGEAVLECSPCKYIVHWDCQGCEA